MTSYEPGTLVQDQTETIEFLSAPSTYNGAPVEVIETHGAYVFLAGDRAIKLKRAVWFPFMDFSTLARRRHFCEAELRLNRRTAPEIYRAVLPVVRHPDGSLALGGDGEAVDWVVEMARFDQETLFDRMAEGGKLDTALMEALADQIASFHAEAEVRLDVDGAEEMTETIDLNLGSLRASVGKPFTPAEVDEVEHLCRSLLADARPLLHARSREGYVRHCHGDLHLRNICLVDGRPTLFDCIEFNDTFAVIDVFYDIAFLMMDLEHRGLRAAANTVLNRYLARTGDFGGLGALQFFLCTRAEVRAHVWAFIAAAQDEGDAAREGLAEAERYVDLVRNLAHPPTPSLIAVGGLSGTGKTTLAHALAPKIGNAPGAVVVRSDVLRKRRHGVDLFSKLPEEAYTRAESAAVYEELFATAAGCLASGVTVIADAVFRNAEERAAIRDVAAAAGVPFAGIWLEVSERTQDDRLRRRVRDVSDATVEIGRAQRDHADPVTDWPTLNADKPLADLRHDAEAVLAEAGVSVTEA